MKLYIAKIEPSSKRGVFDVLAPAGATAIVARMNRMGEGEIVFAYPDTAGTLAGTLESTPLLSLWEDDAPKPAEPIADWRLIGSLNYSSGGWQHLFARAAAPQKQKRAVDTPAPAV